MNTELQYYKSIPIRLIDRKDYATKNAKRYTLNNTNQNIWIPNIYLQLDGTLKQGINIDFIFLKSKNQLEIAGLSLNLLT